MLNIILIPAGSGNTLFSVTFNPSSNSASCTFFNQQTLTKFCQIEYGSKQEDCDSSLTIKSTLGSNIVSIDLPSRFFSNEYCFKVKGIDGTHTAFVEGTYNPGSMRTCIVIIMLILTLF
jgi:hypothetical protein